LLYNYFTCFWYY